jgi:outer membrane protein assembly factor BamB
MRKLIFFKFVMLGLTIPLFAQTQWRFDRTGVYSEENGLLRAWSEKGPEMLWFFEGLGEGHSSVVISNGKIYTTGMLDEKGHLFVLDMNGRLLNKRLYGDEWAVNYPGTRATPTIDNGKIYLISGVGDLICWDETTLDVLWKRNIFADFDAKNIRWGICEAPLIVGEKVIATPGGKKHNIVALNKNNGELIWSSAAKGDVSAYCSPLYIDDQEIPLIVTMTAQHTVGIEVETGKMLWAVENKNKNSIHANTPVYANNMILCASADKSCLMLRLTDGGRKAETVWEIPELDNLMGALVKVGDYIYGSSSGYNPTRFWYCVDWMTGEIKYRDNQFGMGVTIAADGMLYCYSDKGEMALVRATPEKFDLINRFPVEKGTGVHWAHPVIHNGILYMRHGEALIAYKVK